MTDEEKLYFESGLIDSDGNSTYYPADEVAQEAYLKAEYNSILLELLMEE